VAHPYEWAVLRLVPRVERCEFVNVGVLVYCRPLDHLSAEVAVDPARALALDPELDLEAARRHLDMVVALCSGDAAVAGPNALRPIGERFRWLVAPRSTVVQASPVHTGLTDDPDRERARLMGSQVRTSTGLPRAADEAPTN
jgi:hypothetical protein